MIERFHSLSAVAAMALLVSACASFAERPPPSPSLPSAGPSGPAPAIEQRIGELPAQALRASRCGLFLWTRTVDRKLVFFAESGDETSRMMIDGRQQYIPRVKAEGDNVLGQNAEQGYAWRDLRVDVSVQFERRAGLGRGAIVPRGSLKVSNRDGWEYLMPVGGLVACED